MSFMWIFLYKFFAYIIQLQYFTFIILAVISVIHFVVVMFALSHHLKVVLYIIETPPLDALIKLPYFSIDTLYFLEVL